MQHQTEIVDLGRRRVARRRVVAVEAEALYAALANPRRHHELDGSGTVSAVVDGPEALAQGDSFTVGMQLGPVKYRMTNLVTEAIPGRVIEWSLPAGHRWRWELAPLAPGQTQVTEVFDYRGARIPWLMALLGFPRRNGVGIERTLAGLEERFGD
ncbi:SRPBCC family protein [Leucobacter sp. BZR 635]